MRKWILIVLCFFAGICFAYNDLCMSNMTNNAELIIALIDIDPEILEILEEMEDTASPVFEPFFGNEPIELGTTYFELQHNSSLGRNIAVDDEGGVHVCWMKCPTPSYSTRQINYSYIDPTGTIPSVCEDGGMRCDFALCRSGYCTIDVHDCTPFIAYHESNSASSYYHSQVSYDTLTMDHPCTIHGGFVDCDSSSLVTFFPENPTEPIVNIWPVISVSQFDGDIHIISTSNSSDTTLPHYCVYNHGIVESTEVAFRETGVPIFDVYKESPVIATANARDEIAIAFIDYMEDYTCTWVDGMNIILMISTDDGLSWDTINVTNNTGDFHDMPFDTVFYDVTWIVFDSITGDTTYTPGTDTSVFYTRPSGGLSIFYDDEDYIHIAWTEGVYPELACTGGIVTTQTRSDIKHWTNRTDEINSALGTDIVRNGNWPGELVSDSRSFYNCYSPNGACSDDGTIYIIWQQYFGELFWSELLPEDDSSIVYWDYSEDRNANQEIFVNFSTDYGATWFDYPINVSNTYSPGCESGDCHSELDPTIARKIDDKIHLFWVDDVNPGTLITDFSDIYSCPVKYVAIPIDDIEDALTDIKEKEFFVGTPEQMTLASNYPNPFNMATEIAFSIEEAGKYAVEVYDIEGKLVRILANSYMAKGEHITAWNGTDMSGNTVTSGTYLYRIRDDKGNSIVRSMSLVK